MAGPDVVVVGFLHTALPSSSSPCGVTEPWNRLPRQVVGFSFSRDIQDPPGRFQPLQVCDAVILSRAVEGAHRWQMAASTDSLYERARASSTAKCPDSPQTRQVLYCSQPYPCSHVKEEKSSAAG